MNQQKIITIPKETVLPSPSMNPHYIQSTNTDVLTPSVAMTEITSIVCDMIQENIDYVAKNGLTEKARINRERLLRLLHITETFNQLSCSNAALKTANEYLHREHMQTKQELLMLQQEINLANSI